MVNPLTPYLKIFNFAAEPIIKAGFALVAIGIVMVGLGYDPVSLSVSWVEQTLRSILGI